MTDRDKKRKKLLDQVPKTPDDVLDKTKLVEDEDPVFGLNVMIPKGLKDLKDSLEDD